MTTFAYDYQNQYTRGWVRAVFDPLAKKPLNSVDDAKAELTEVARKWATGTDLRLVEIAGDETETYPKVTAKGCRGPLPNNK